MFIHVRSAFGTRLLINAREINWNIIHYPLAISIQQTKTIGILKKTLWAIAREIGKLKITLNVGRFDIQVFA